jgi:alkylation response protein AidB-like acyl-CoA dehydrogenase
MTTQTLYKEKNAHPLVQKAANFTEELRKRGKEIDELRQLPQDLFDSLDKEGLFRFTIPKIFGGHQVNWRTFIDINTELAKGNASVAWVSTLINIGNWIAVNLYPEETQKEIISAGPVYNCGVIEPRKFKGRRVEGGYYIEEGHWGFASGCRHATWIGFGFPIFDDQGNVVNQGLGITEAKNVIIKDDWHTIGLRGTGSHSMEIRDLFVPDRRVALFSEVLQGKYAAENLRDQPEYRAAFVPVLALILVAPILGMAQAALEIFLEKLSNRKIQYTWYAKQGEATVTHLKVAEAAMKIESAILHTHRAADDIDRWAASGEHMDVNTRVRVRADTGHIVKLCSEAIDILLSESGGSVIAESNLLSQIARDARGASNHGVVVPSTNMELYGRILCGQEPNTMLI